ncbi:MFS transporter, partial [Mycolicibacterium insubricum]|uniref:MFS transporter n=1 Tax=Mycolicibacterium insubricum TaxID=444597 RepID=UPI0021F3697D
AAVPVVVPGSYQSLRYWQLAVTLAGVWLLAAGIGVGLAYWWVFLSMAVPAVVYGALSYTIPESPRYLVAKFRIPEARKVLTMLL